MGILGKSGIFGTGTSMGGGGIVIPSNGFKVNITGEGGLSSQLSLVKSAAVNVSGEGGLDADLHNFKSLASNVSGEGGLDGTVTGGGFTGLLDTYPNAAAAYSLRQLSSTYAAPTESEFSFGNALQFDGVNDYVSFPSLSITGDFTFNFWFKADFTAKNSPMIFSNNASARYFRFVQNYNATDSAFYVQVGTTLHQFNFSSKWIDNQPYMLTVIRDGSNNLKCFLNGVESNLTGVVDSSNTTFHLLGAYYTLASFGFYNGDINEVGYLQGTTATAQNILDLYNGGDGANFETIMGGSTVYWRMNGSGTDTTAIDETGNYNGTLNNFPTSGMWVDGKANKGALVEIAGYATGVFVENKTFYPDENNELSPTSTDAVGTTLANWLSANSITDGYVRTWYDQSGNAKDFVQTTTSNQPQIISTGALILIDSNKPSILALDDSLLTVPSSKAYFKFLHDGTKSFVSNVLETPSVVSNLEFIWMTQDTGGSDVGADFSINTSEFRQFTRNGGGGAQRNENKWTVTSSSYETVSLTFDADNATAADRVVANVNSGADIATNTRAFAASTADSQNDMHLFNYFVPTSNLGFTGKYQELIFWGSDQSANRTGIETNQNDYYTIYP